MCGSICPPSTMKHSSRNWKGSAIPCKIWQFLKKLGSSKTFPSPASDFIITSKGRMHFCVFLCLLFYTFMHLILRARLRPKDWTSSGWFQSSISIISSIPYVMISPLQRLYIMKIICQEEVGSLRQKSGRRGFCRLIIVLQIQRNKIKILLRLYCIFWGGVV